MAQLDDDIAIRVEHLGKLYRIGQRDKYKTLRESVMGWLGRDAKAEPTAASSNDFWALSDVNFEVKRGEVVGIIGRNGAGKSTLLKVLSRITEPTRGRVEITGRVGSLLEVGTGFHPELTGRENVFLNGAILGMREGEIRAKFDEIVAFAEIEQFIDTPVKRYSSGMYTRLAFAVAAHLEPDVLIVDEVLAVGDFQFQQKCMGKMQDVASHGRTVLFVSHNMPAVQRLCQRCVVLEGGRVIDVRDTKAAIDTYTERMQAHVVQTDLSARTDRTGNGRVRLTSFRVAAAASNASSDSVAGGEDVEIVLGYACPPGVPLPRNLDVGISIGTEFDGLLAVFYSSYANQALDVVAPAGEFRCRVPRLPLAAGTYSIGARVFVAGEEADWPRDGVGQMRVVPGDFFGTGRAGFEGRAPMLLGGSWRVEPAA